MPRADATYRAEGVVVKQGSTTTEFTYTDYEDWSNPLHKIEAFYAGKMKETRNGAVVRHVTTVQTETSQVYVMMPVPGKCTSGDHGSGTAIVERLTRKGDEVLYEVTAEDPDVLVEPWVMAPRTLRIYKAPDAGLIPEHAYCEVYETQNISSQIRH